MPTLLVSFCNQVSSPDLCLALVDSETGELRWVDRGFAEPINGATGLAVQGDLIRVAFQGSDSDYIGTYLSADFSLINIRRLRLVKDVHSLCVHEGELLAVSTGTNELYRMRRSGTRLIAEEPVWRHPQAVAAESDEVHVNSLWAAPNGRLVVTSFGERVNGGWPECGGRAAYLDNNELLINGLKMPHNGGIAGGVAFACDSSRMRVVFGDGGEVLLPGFARGVWITDDELIVGVSGFRLRSRGTSRRRVDPDEYESAHPCQLAYVSLSSRAVTRRIDLSDYGAEIYDVIQLTDAPRMAAPAHSAMRSRIRALETEHLGTIDRLADVQDQLARQQRSVEDLQGDITNLHREAAELRSAHTAAVESAAAAAAAQLASMQSFIDYQSRAEATLQRQAEAAARAAAHAEALQTALAAATAESMAAVEAQRAHAMRCDQQLAAARSVLRDIEQSRAWWWLSLWRRMRHQMWRNPVGFIRSFSSRSLRIPLLPPSPPVDSEPPHRESTSRG